MQSLHTYGFRTVYGTGVEIHVPGGGGTQRVGAIGDKVAYSSTLYLVRSTSSRQYTVFYNANGGSGAVPSPELCYEGDSYWPDFRVLPDPPAPDMEFYSWNTHADGTGFHYVDPWYNWSPQRLWSLTMPNNDITLYAIYRHESPIEGMWQPLPAPEGYAYGDSIDLAPGDTLHIKLDKSLFAWRRYERDLTLQILEEAEVKVRTRVGNGSMVIGSLGMVERDGEVYVTLQSTPAVCLVTYRLPSKFTW